MEFNAFPPGPALNSLAAQMEAGSKNFNLGPTDGSNPYLNFNTISPNKTARWARWRSAGRSSTRSTGRT